MEKFRLTDEEGIVRDIVISKTEDVGFKKGIACVVNLDEIIHRNINTDILTKCTFTKESLKRHKIEPLVEEPNFVKLQDLYSLFAKAKEVYLLEVLTIYSDSSYFDDIEENYSCDIVYLRIDNLFTEIILSSRADVQTDNWGIEYVYVFQSEFKNDLSLDLFTNPILHQKRIFNKKIQVAPLSKNVLEGFLNVDGFPPFQYSDYIGIDLEELIIYSFLSSDSNLTWGSGIIFKEESKSETLSLTIE